MGKSVRVEDIVQRRLSSISTSREDSFESSAGEFSSPHPALADLRTQGLGLTFSWLPSPDGGRWQAIASPRSSYRLPTRLPRFALPAQRPARGKGRPSKLFADPVRSQTVALLVDCGGVNQREATRLLYGSVYGDCDLERDCDFERDYKRVRDALKAGRELFVLAGVLPWWAFLCDGGQMPSEWWTTDRFAEGVQAWIEDSITHPARREPTTVQERLKQQNADLQAEVKADGRRQNPWFYLASGEWLEERRSGWDESEQRERAVAALQAKPGWRIS